MCSELCDEKPSRSEIERWRILPLVAESSSRMIAYARKNRFKAKERASVMCQNCGSVVIIGGERLESYKKNGFAYCDKECMYEDRGRVYRNNPEVFDKHCETRGTTRRYPHTKVAVKNCSQCKKLFVSRNTTISVCSDECRLDKSRADASAQSFIKSRRAQAPVETKCRHCGVAFTSLTRTEKPHHYCSRDCTYRFWKKTARKKNKQKHGHIKREKTKLPAWVVRGDLSLSGLYARSNGKCVQCKCSTVISKEYRSDQATVDHIVPMSKGGLHIQDNLQLMCQKCNSAKSDTITGSARLTMF